MLQNIRGSEFQMLQSLSNPPNKTAETLKWILPTKQTCGKTIYVYW